MSEASIRVGDICYVIQSQHDQTMDYIQREKLTLAVNNLIIKHGYSRMYAELKLLNLTKLVIRQIPGMQEGYKPD